MTLRTPIRALLLSVMIAALGACSKPPQITAPQGVEITPLKTYSRIESWALLKFAGVKSLGAAYAVDTYHVNYPVTADDGTVSRASGLLALPRDATPRRIVSFQHGTTTNRENVPSRLDLTGIAASVIFAGNGYMLLAPDYLGLGDSPGVHGYYVASDEARAVTSFIAAARQIPHAPSGPVFLSGFSQGGHVTLAAMRQMESDGERLLGAAPVATAIDIRHLSLGIALEGGSPSDTLYLAYIARGFADHYGHALDSVLTPEAAALVETLFGTPHSGAEIVAALPADPRVIFQTELLEAFDKGGTHWFLEAIEGNDFTDMRPKAPLRLYYGESDIDVVPQEAIKGAERFTTSGTNVRAVNVGPVNHDASLLAAAPLIYDWLQELEACAAETAINPDLCDTKG
tara:strand:- start:457 stop:1659 length:1203 start_codon:yes stop_codon:yes gene_type:complete